MNKTALLVAVFLLLVCLSGCGWTGLAEKFDSMTIKEPAISKNLIDIISKMEDTHGIIAGKKHTEEERKQSSNEYIKELKLLLLSEESMELTDKRLQQLLKQRIVSITKTTESGDKPFKVRMVSFQVPAVDSGELLKTWVLLQWQWGGEPPQVQVILSGDAFAPNAAELLNQSGVPVLTLAEYPSVDLPYAKQVSNWLLGADGWVNEKIENK